VEFRKDIYTEEYLRSLGLNERQIKAVDHIKANKIINLSSYKALIKNVSEKTLYRDLQELVDKRILKKIAKIYGERLCQPVRYNVRLSEAPAYGKTIYEYAPGCNGAQDYRELVRNIANDPELLS